MTTQPFPSVWDAIENTPAEAENMRLRSMLLMHLVDAIHEGGMTQAQAAKSLGVTQPRISDLMRGRIDLFALDSLVNMTAALGLHIGLTISKPQAA